MKNIAYSCGTKVVDGRAIEVLVATKSKTDGALLPLLHDIQGQYGYIPSEALPILSQELQLSIAEIHGVISFYPDFHTSPQPPHTIKICRAESCQAMGAHSLIAHAERKVGTRLGITDGSGLVSLEPVYCLGNCALSPAIMIDGKLHGRVSIARFDSLVEEMEA